MNKKDVMKSDKHLLIAEQNLKKSHLMFLFHIQKRKQIVTMWGNGCVGQLGCVSCVSHFTVYTHIKPSGYIS